jgi:hypothetical protein
MFRGETGCANHLLSSDPDGARPTDEGEGIVADDLGGALESEDHGVIRIRANGIELIRYTKYNACGVGAIY